MLTQHGIASGRAVIVLRDLLSWKERHIEDRDPELLSDLNLLLEKVQKRWQRGYELDKAETVRERDNICRRFAARR